LGYFFLTVAICGLFNFLLHKKDLIFQKQLERQTNQETDLIKHRDLIIKKDLGKVYFQKYNQTLNKTKKIANKEDLFYTAAFVVPSYSLIKYSKYFFLPFATNSNDFVAFHMFTDLLDAVKKMIERIRNYTYYFSAKKRLNEFLAQEERNDIQKDIIVPEPIILITLKKVSFVYQENKPVLEKLDLQFKKGEINYLTGENGYGKSTIISLIMGLYQPNEGKILINNKYKVSEINLIK
jgi:ABC-type siderophore export system fused ATPase/permease subunit